MSEQVTRQLPLDARGMALARRPRRRTSGTTPITDSRYTRSDYQRAPITGQG